MKPSPEHDPWSILLDVMHSAAGVDDARNLAEVVVRRLLACHAIVSGGVWLRSGDELVCLVQHGFERPPSIAQIYRVIENGAPLFSDNAESSRAATQRAFALAYLPLATAHERIGALVVQGSAAQLADERALFEAVAAHLTVALQNAQAQRSPASAGQAAEREWDAFLSHAAHEIKNPLASIKGYADLLVRRASKDPADPYQKGLTIIAQQVGRTTRLLEQISDIARVGTGRVRLDRHKTDLATLVRRVVGEYQAANEQHQIRLESADDQLITHCDAERISQIVDALLSNAIKFSPQGGPVLVRLQREPGGDEVIISVSDQGVGVPAGEQERVFERFFRGSNVAGSYRGLGVSLFLARTLAVRHGGRLWLESEPGQGTTAYLALPAH
jgi:signal transduction histidine kinase